MPREARLRNARMPLAIRDVGFARFHPREHLGQAGAALFQLRGRLLERGSALVELLGTRFEPREARFLLANLT